MDSPWLAPLSMARQTLSGPKQSILCQLQQQLIHLMQKKETGEVLGFLRNRDGTDKRPVTPMLEREGNV